MLQFVMSYHDGPSAERFQLILDHWDDLVEMASPFHILFTGPTEYRLRTELPHSYFHYVEPPDEKKFRRVSRKWATIAQHVEENVECTCWFWWEPDVVPVKKDCFEFFLRLWGDQTRIMGFHVKDKMWGMYHCINGAAFYSKRYWSYLQPWFSFEATFDTRKPFNPRTERAEFVELNRWYALVHHEKRLRLTPAMRLVHGIKDTTLLEQLLEGNRNYPVVPGWYRALHYQERVFRLHLNPKRIGKPES